MEFKRGKDKNINIPLPNYTTFSHIDRKMVRIGQTECATEMLTCCTGSNLVAMLFKLFCLFNSQGKK